MGKSHCFVFSESSVFVWTGFYLNMASGKRLLFFSGSFRHVAVSDMQVFSINVRNLEYKTKPFCFITWYAPQPLFFDDLAHITLNFLSSRRKMCRRGMTTVYPNLISKSISSFDDVFWLESSSILWKPMFRNDNVWLQISFPLYWQRWRCSRCMFGLKKQMMFRVFSSYTQTWPWVYIYIRPVGQN